MTVHIAFLRAVNVGGHGKIAMADLRDFMTGLGFTARTLLQSGNIAFQGARSPTASLEEMLEAEAAKRLDLRSDFLVRTAAELEAIVAQNPYPAEAKSDPGHLVVMVLKAAPAAAAVKALQGAVKGRESLTAIAREAYAVYPDGIGKSKLTNAVIESKLGMRATGRNWNTVLKLVALAREMAGQSLDHLV